MRKIVRCSIVMSLGLAVLCPALAIAQEPCANPWRPVDVATGQVTQIDELQRLLEAFPDSGSVHLRLLTALLKADRAEEAITVAQALVARGYSFGPGSAAMLQGMGASPQWRAVNVAKGEPVTASRAVDEVPAGVLLVESVWREAQSGILFATSVVSRGLYRKGDQGTWAPVTLDAAGSLTGMGYDPGHNLLWLASGTTEVTPAPETAFRGLIAIDPAQGIEVRRVPGPPDSSPSDVAVARDGTVYASDPLTGAVLRAGPTDGALETVLPPGTLRSPQGLVVLDDGRLVVSDYRYGLALVDPAQDCVARIASASPLLLDGIDGLWRRGQTLVAVQNGTRPMRIVELDLAADSASITGIRVLEQAHPEWTEPLGGSLDGEGLVYVANGQWGRFDPGGSLVDGAAPDPTQIRRLALAVAGQVESP